MASHVSQGMARPNACVTHGKPCVTRYAKANAYVTHGKPCVHMHANGHAYKWYVFVKEGEGSRKGKDKGRKEELRKGEKKERKERKERKRKRKRERGRRPVVSSSVHWHFEGRNLLDQGVKSGDSTRGYASRGKDSSYFGLFLAFGILF